jgi:hypothetical protein
LAVDRFWFSESAIVDLHFIFYTHKKRRQLLVAKIPPAVPWPRRSRAKAGVADASSTRLPSDSLDSLLDDGDVASSAANEKEGGAATRVMAPAVVHDPPMSIGDIAQSVPANGVADASQSLRKEVADRPTPSGGVLPPISGPTATKQPIHDDEPIHSSPQQPAAASEPAAAGVPANDNGQLAEAASQLEALSLGEGAKAPAPKKGTLERSRRSPRMAAVAKQLASDRVTSRQVCFRQWA